MCSAAGVLQLREGPLVGIGDERDALVPQDDRPAGLVGDVSPLGVRHLLGRDDVALADAVAEERRVRELAPVHGRGR